jgi:hypothetical protein
MYSLELAKVHHAELSAEASRARLARSAAKHANASKKK